MDKMSAIDLNLNKDIRSYVNIESDINGEVLESFISVFLFQKNFGKSGVNRKNKFVMKNVLRIIN